MQNAVLELRSLARKRSHSKNAHQDFAEKDAALGFACAGTPDLPDHLAELGVTSTKHSVPIRINGGSG